MVRVCVLGEALIDIVRDPYGEETEHVGGSPLNVAVGLAALDHVVDFATTFGADPHGERIRTHLADRGVHVLAGSETGDPTSTARAELDEAGAASYTFDLHWNLPTVTLEAGTGHAHTGSIGALLHPGDAHVRGALAAVRQSGGTVSYDPNVRPTIMGPVREVRPRVEELIALSDVVKASSDDLEVLYPDQSVESVLTRWCELGAALAVATLGAHGVTYRVAGEPDTATLPTRASAVVDTVGAGDSFMAGLLSALLDAGLLGDPAARARLATGTLEGIRPAIDRGLACSGLTVGHAGAYAPRRAELDPDTA